SYITQRNIGFAVGLAGFVVAAIAVGGAVHIGSQSKFIPVYVLVDKLNNALTAGRGDYAQATPQDVVKAQLARWIEDVRTVTPDKVIKLKQVKGSYALIQDGDPAKTKLDTWFSGQGKNKNNIVEAKEDPFARAASEAVEVQTQGLPLPISPESWQYDWTEIVRDRKGNETDRFNMRVIFTTKQIPPESEEAILVNPSSTFITDFSWSRQF
ncbi:VirB8/TrbF family protein, partial [Metapseudomonas furukawaii]